MIVASVPLVLYIILAVVFVVLLFAYMRVRGNRIRRGG
jgi:hypothetical protein